jgi:hypothetical protein
MDKFFRPTNNSVSMGNDKARICDAYFVHDLNSIGLKLMGEIL